MSSPIKPTIKSEIIPILLLIISAVASVYFYSRFPEQVPIHWNFEGQVDNWGSRFTGAALIPLVTLGIYLLFLVIPYLDSRKERYSQFRKVYHFFKAYFVFFMTAIFLITGFNVLGANLPISFWVPFLVGVLFILIGNYMGKIKMNWFMGIRTPWTLSSEEVWNKTHRFGGKVFILGGILMIPMYFIPVSLRMPLFFAIIILIVIGTIGYSYFLYRSEQKKK